MMKQLFVLLFLVTICIATDSAVFGDEDAKSYLETINHIFLNEIYNDVVNNIDNEDISVEIRATICTGKEIIEKMIRLFGYEQRKAFHSILIQYLNKLDTCDVFIGDCLSQRVILNVQKVLENMSISDASNMLITDKELEKKMILTTVALLVTI